MLAQSLFSSQVMHGLRGVSPSVELYQNALEKKRWYAVFFFSAAYWKWAGKRRGSYLTKRLVLLGLNKPSLKPWKGLGYNLSPGETPFKRNVAVSSGASRGDALPSVALWYLRRKTGETKEPHCYLFSTLCPSAPVPPTAVLRPLAAPLRQWKKRRLGQMTESRRRLNPPPLTQLANHDSEPLICDGVADQLASARSSSGPIECQFCPSRFTAEFRGLQPAASRVSRLNFFL